MAVIAFPSPPARIVSFGMRPVSPGQVLHEAIYTGARQVYNRGPQYFEGVCEFGPLHASDSTQQAEIRQFFNQLNGYSNTFRVDLYRTGFYRRRGTLMPSLDAGGDPVPVTVATSESAGDNMRIGLSAGDTGIVRGDFLTINDRLFVVATSLEGRVLEVSPNVVVLPDDAEVNFVSPTVHCRMVGETPTSLNESAFFEGWSFNWVEVV